jgi:pimeloyl-ACP methyl ester carboxylesterase/DNA-binding CsgD family transcriptional regulator
MATMERDRTADGPVIRYAGSADGTRIAYAAWGHGPALVVTPSLPVSNLELEWRSSRYRSFWGALAEQRTLVRFDCRGSGLSQRQVDDFSLGALAADIEAVVDALSLERFALVGFSHYGPASIAYAVQRPDRLSHLVLWYSYARATEYNRASRVGAGRSLITKDWELYTETEGHRIASGMGSPTAAQRYTALLRESVDASVLLKAFADIDRFDVTDLLPAVRVPTLVLHRRESRILAVETARALASTIPDARLRLLEGRSLVPFSGDHEALANEIRGFLAEEHTLRLPDGLSPREGDVLRLIASGRSNREIAEDLVISERTVARHITNLYQKIGARNKSEATAYALRHGLR